MNFYIKKHNFLWKSILTKAAVLFFLIVFLNLLQYQIRNYFYIISSPVSKVFWKSGSNISNLFGSFLNAKQLEQQNGSLRDENQNLISQIDLLQENTRQDQALKEATDNTSGDNFKIVLAKVSGLDSSNDFMLIDKGINDGISENMPVISSQKVLYGKILKVYPRFSQIMLISNKNSITDVRVQTTDPSQPAIDGAIKGSGHLSMYLDLIDSNSQIQENDALVSSGLDGIFPDGLLIGKITQVHKNDLGPFQTAGIMPFFNVANIDSVFVITNYHKK